MNRKALKIANAAADYDAAKGYESRGQIACNVVVALEAAGLLREPNDGACQVVCERDERLRQIATLERDLAAANKERDEARRNLLTVIDRENATAKRVAKEREQSLWEVREMHATMDRLQEDAATSRSREASPAMLRVVEAFRVYEHTPNGGTWTVLRDALAALAAPAVEKARYEVRSWYDEWMVGMPHNGGFGVRATGLTQQQAERIAAVLNDAEAAR